MPLAKPKEHALVFMLRCYSSGRALDLSLWGNGRTLDENAAAALLDLLSRLRLLAEEAAAAAEDHSGSWDTGLGHRILEAGVSTFPSMSEHAPTIATIWL